MRSKMNGVLQRTRLGVEQLEPRLAMSTFFVSPDGSNDWDGSESTPWLTLQYAANSVQAGDTVIVRAGNYAGFDLRTDGTAESPITFYAEPDVVIDTRNPRTPDGINLEGADYIIIENFTVVGMPRTGIRSVLNTNVVIRGNTLDENGFWGILTGWSENVLIENNVASRSVREHGIYVSNSADNPIIRNNVVWGNWASGIQLNADLEAGEGNGIISGALVEQNILYDNGRGGGAALNNDGVQDSIFRNNLLYNNHATGLVLYAFNGAEGSKNNLVINNTIIGPSDGRWVVYIQNGSTGNTLYNNIFYSEHSFRGIYDISEDSLEGFTSDYNILMSRFAIDEAFLTFDEWREHTGQDLYSFLATPDELFVNPAEGDYYLRDGSPAIDAGTSTSAPDVDLAGSPRPAGNGWDIGAYEWGSG